MPDADTSLPALVRTLRQQALLSQEELAERSGLSVGSIRGLEAGRVRRPRGASIRLLAKVLARTETDRDRLLAAAGGEAFTATGTSVGTTAPAQLPPATTGFTGRTADLRRLDELLDGSVAEQSPQAVVITAIGGTAGVGKTALALHWAHRVAGRFPDGQLYVNLRGYDPDQPLPADAALARFLTALGVAGQDIPLDLEERAARYRSELSGRRVLIVLDNASSAAQVRPLLPGSGSCLVVVTSRDSLAGLVAVDGAHRLDLDLLAPGEAIGLLRRLIGSRVDAEPEAAAILAEQCVRLPLALRIAAELAVARPESTLVELATELADRQARLDLLDASNDPYAAVREVFSWSIQHLPLDAAFAFRLLGLHPGPDLDPYALAALAGTGPDHARRTLEILARAHLVHRTGGGRYGTHDLLRAYAAHLALTKQTDPERHTARQRLFSYYQAAAVSAMDTLRPGEAHYRPDVTTTTPLPDLTNPDAARAWLDADRACLIAAAADAAPIDASGFAVGMARILHRYLRDAHLTDLISLNDHAYRAAEQAGDPIGQAHALRQLGTAYSRMSRFEVANEHHQAALARFHEAGDLIGEGLALTGLGVVQGHQGKHEQAVETHVRAISVARQAGDRLSEAIGLNNLAIIKRWLRRYDEATDHHEQALANFRELGARYSEAVTRTNLGDIELRQGRYAHAADHLREALATLRDLGAPIVEASALDTLGALHVRLGEPEQATAYLQQALDCFRRIGVRGGQARSLNGLGQAARLAGNPVEALAHHAAALAIANDTSYLPEQARAHAGRGHAHRDLGDHDLARVHYKQAYGTYTDLGMPEAEDVLASLTTLTRDQA